MTATPVTDLAQYRNLEQYHPAVGDLVVWSGWFTQWHGLVRAYDQATRRLSIVFAVTPFMLLTLSQDEIDKETVSVDLSRIVNASKGAWAVLKHDRDHNAAVWYV